MYDKTNKVLSKIIRLLKGDFDADKGRFKHIKSVAIFSCQSPTSAIIDDMTFEKYLVKVEKTTLQAWNAKSMFKANPDDYEGNPLNLQLKESFTNSDFENIYNSNH